MAVLHTISILIILNGKNYSLLGEQDDSNDEQDKDGNDITVKITREEAIRRQIAAGVTKDYVYPNDETALADFIEIHWAWEEDDVIKATPDHPQCEGCEDMAECIDAVKFLGDDATCIKARSNRLLDAKDINYNSQSFIDRWAYPVIVMVITSICIYAGYKVITFEGPIF